MHTVHGKQREFTTELVAILQREALLQNAKLNKANNELIKEKGKLERKLKASNEKLEDITVNKEKVEQLRKDYTLNVATLSNCERHIGTLQSELNEARELAEQLQSAVDSNSQVETLKEALDKETQLTTQLKTALDAKQNHIKKIDESSLEANNILEERNKKNEENILALRSEKISLQKGLDFAKELNNNIIETRDKAENSLKTVTFQYREQSTQLQIVTTEVSDLKINKKNLEQEVNSLKTKIKDLEEREQLYLETEKIYEQNFRDIADKTYDTTQFLEELRNSGDPNRTLYQELNSKETQTTLDLQNIIKQNNEQADLISVLQKVT